MGPPAPDARRRSFRQPQAAATAALGPRLFAKRCRPTPPAPAVPGRAWGDPGMPCDDQNAKRAARN
eukprot:14768429-Alexandrium_andersonii.AAC.1